MDLIGIAVEARRTKALALVVTAWATDVDANPTCSTVEARLSALLEAWHLNLCTLDLQRLALIDMLPAEVNTDVTMHMDMLEYDTLQKLRHSFSITPRCF